MLSRGLWPEFSRQYGDKADETMRELYCRGTVASSDGVTVLSFMGPSLIQWWTYGVIVYIPGFFNLVMFVTALSRSYQVGLILLATLACRDQQACRLVDCPYQRVFVKYWWCGVSRPSTFRGSTAQSSPWFSRRVCWPTRATAASEYFPMSTTLYEHPPWHGRDRHVSRCEEGLGLYRRLEQHHGQDPFTV